MPFSINPDLIENNDVEIQTVDGELALFHKPSGNTLIVDEDTTVSEKLQSPLRDDVDLDGNDLNSGGSGEFAALEAENVEVTDLLESGLVINSVTMDMENAESTTFTNTDFSNVITFAGGGVLPLNDVPDKAQLEGRINIRLRNDSDELTEVKPRVQDLSGGPHGAIPELTVSSTSSDEYVDSGWVEITSLDIGDRYIVRGFRARVDGGEGEIANPNRYAGIEFRWVLK